MERNTPAEEPQRGAGDEMPALVASPASRSLRAPWKGGNEDAGLWPYVNLVYLFFAFLPLLFQREVEALELGATVLATLLFLPLYFGFYASEGRGQLLRGAAIAGLGYALIPFNLGGNTFVIYAIALAAHSLPARTAVAIMLLLVLAIGLQIVLIAPGAWPYVAITGAVGAMVLIGTAYARVDARRNAELRLSQEEVKRLARSAERERIGRDLHDLLGHTLSLVALKSELALKLLDREPARARVEMADVERITRDALAQVRRAVSGIRAAGIEAELAGARLTLLSAGVRLDYRLQAPPMAVETETVLALAVREAVTNVLRHARAQRVEVELTMAGERARLTISDDGRGVPVVPGNGLTGMRERIESLGGTLAIASTPGAGTRLTICVPVPSGLQQGALDAAGAPP